MKSTHTIYKQVNVAELATERVDDCFRVQVTYEGKTVSRIFPPEHLFKLLKEDPIREAELNAQDECEECGAIKPAEGPVFLAEAGAKPNLENLTHG